MENIGRNYDFCCGNNLKECASLSSHTPSTGGTTSQTLCDPCLILEKEEVGISLCSECDERLCVYCTNQHKTRKLTKNHVLTSIVCTSIMVECGICDKETDRNSSIYCAYCEETLCKRCEQKHKEKNIFKNHKLVLLERKALICDPCKQNDEMKNAETFCSICKENLCDICTRYHRAQKATKDHELKSNFQKVSLNAIVTHCDPCNEDGAATKATGVCVQCEEHLCDECARQHKLMKVMKDHQINVINDVWCGQCQEDNIFENAVKYCPECNEHLCSDCCKTHRRFKLTKYHKVVDVQNTKQVKTSACGVCKIESKNTKFCEQCGLTFCHVCIEEHSPLKGTCTKELHTEQMNGIQRLGGSFIENLKTRTDMNTVGEVIDVKNIKSKQDRPGKPRASCDMSEVVTLTWHPPSEFRDNDLYQINYKELENDRKWKLYDEKFRAAPAELDDLPSNTVVVFRVRVIHEEYEGPYSEESNEIRTPVSAACQILQKSAILVKGNLSPPVYTLPMKEERHERVKINKLEFGSAEAVGHSTINSKTILLVGGTGSGKSTLIDFIVNYALGVNWNDQFRYKVTGLDQETRNRNHSHATSLTDWITCYTINCQKGSRINYQLNVIDTPGFGNTDGLKKDKEIVNQMRDLLSDKQQYGLAMIDAICFVIKADESRLTPYQTYIFQSVLSLFGKDIEQHICSFITFADCMRFPALDTLREYKFPFGEAFMFNNAGLLCTNDDDCCAISRVFWRMGIKSLHSFFTYTEQLETKSLQWTKMVLLNQFLLRETTENLMYQIEVLMMKKNRLEHTRQKLVDDRPGDGSPQTLDVGSERVIEELEQEVKENSSDIEKSIDSIKAYNDRLKEISLFCRPSSCTEYLEILIQNEELEKSEGYLERIKLLKEFRRTETLGVRIASDFEGHV